MVAVRETAKRLRCKRGGEVIEPIFAAGATNPSRNSLIVQSFNDQARRMGAEYDFLVGAHVGTVFGRCGIRDGCQPDVPAKSPTPAHCTGPAAARELRCIAHRALPHGGVDLQHSFRRSKPAWAWRLQDRNHRHVASIAINGIDPGPAETLGLQVFGQGYAERFGQWPPPLRSAEFRFSIIEALPGEGAILRGGCGVARLNPGRGVPCTAQDQACQADQPRLSFNQLHVLCRGWVTASASPFAPSAAAP